MLNATILYILLRNFHLEGSRMLCGSLLSAHDNLCRQILQPTIIRPVVARLRPIIQSSTLIVEMVYIVKRVSWREVMVSPSCHAKVANSLGLAMFVVFLFRKRWLKLFSSSLS